MRVLTYFLCLFVLTVGCSGKNEVKTENVPADVTPSLGIRPNGDTEIKPDLTQVSDELQEVFAYIDEHIDEDVVRLQRELQQPSISNTGEGIPETAQRVRGYFEELGCQESTVHEVGETEWGAQGNPVVYARCDVGAERTLLLYWMYDTMPITQPDLWNYPPFDAEIVEQPPFSKVVIARGASNSKGPQMSQLSALLAIKTVTGTLPVNLIVVAEGDEERMSIGFRKFVKDNVELFEDADAMFRFGGQGFSGGASITGGSEGCVYIELTTSGAAWGRGPAYGDIHGWWKRSSDSPAIRHITMLSSLYSDDGNRALVDGFYDDIEPLAPEIESTLRRNGENLDLEQVARNVGVGRFMTDDPVDYLRMQYYGMSFNLDGIWGGNMYGGGAGAILPSQLTSKHNIRYVPVQDGIELTSKIRTQLDRNGYEDVEMRVIGDVPWCKMGYDTDVANALKKTYDIFGISYGEPPAIPQILGGYWPAYLFGRDPLVMPIVAGGAGHGGGAHANNEYYVIEGAGKVYGLAGAEKAFATSLYNFGGKN